MPTHSGRMRVTFPRLVDHQRAYAIVERDDGVVYQMYGSTAGPELPHDIRHLIVERELRVSDGIWGTVAAGTVYQSMHHLSGRRPPHAAERSAQFKRAQRDRIRRAELLANLVEEIALLDEPTTAGIMRLAQAKLSAIPMTEPGNNPADVVALPPPEVLAAAARALQVEAARWARLRVGEELQYEWPYLAPGSSASRAASRALRAIPGQRQGDAGRRSPRGR